MKTLLPWFKANLILQTPAALGLFHNGQVCWDRLPGRGGVCVCVCMCVGGVPGSACVCSQFRVGALVRVCAGAQRRVAGRRAGGAASLARAQLGRSSGVLLRRLQGRPRPQQQKPEGQTGEKPDVLLPPLRLPWGH